MTIPNDLRIKQIIGNIESTKRQISDLKKMDSQIAKNTDAFNVQRRKGVLTKIERLTQKLAELEARKSSIENDV